jgi:hypothetical protein
MPAVFVSCNTLLYCSLRCSGAFRNCHSLTASVLLLSFALSVQPEFYRVCHTKAQYDEEGPRIARHSPVFSASM